jgi:hypothetical protein
MNIRPLFVVAFALALLAPAGAFGTTPAQPFEALSLMHVVGTLATDVDGSVVAAQVDTRLDEDLKAAVERTVRGFRFRPVLVGGEARRVRVAFDVSLAARKAPAGKGYEVTIEGTQFHPVKSADLVEPDSGEGYEVIPETMTPPGYPREAEFAGAMGRVLLAVRFNLEGSVEDVAVVGSLLYDTKVPEPVGRRSLAAFERVAMQVARSWRAKIVPGKNAKPSPGGYTAYAPVVFTVSSVDLDADGQWIPVRRLPNRAIPWQPKDGPGSEINDAGLSSGLAALGGGGIELAQSARGTPVL